MAREAAEFDREAMLAELDGDEELVTELINTMRAEAPKLVHEVRVAVNAADPALVTRAAHTLKGAVSNFGARAAADAALRLEQMGRAGDLSHAGPALDTLEVVMSALMRELEKA